MTTARTNDVVAARDMVLGLGPRIEARATHVFDLGYYDYARRAKLDAAGCRISTPLTPIEERATPTDGAVLSDRVGRLPARLAKSRRNPFDAPVREIRVRIETGKALRILTGSPHEPDSRGLDRTIQLGRSLTSGLGPPVKPEDDEVPSDKAVRAVRI